MIIHELTSITVCTEKSIIDGATIFIALSNDKANEGVGGVSRVSTEHAILDLYQEIIRKMRMGESA